MLCINLESDNPYFNLAVEEILLKNRNDEYLIFGVNSQSVVIGKHQVTPREVDVKYVSLNHIPVIRRISGGGTVYHDEGNLNFTFIRNSEEGKQIDFRKYTQTAIDFLTAQGIDARFEGKNDIRINGLKISGNAEHVHRNRVLHHGTMLFSTSLDSLRKSIKKDPSCYASRGVESVRSSVANLDVYLKKFRNISEFRSGMINFFLAALKDTSIYRLSPPEIEEAEMLARSKYMTWEWNWAYGPEYQFENSFQLGNVPVTVSLSVREGLIIRCRISETGKLANIADRLIGCRHMPVEIMKIFNDENVPLTKEEIFNFF